MRSAIFFGLFALMILLPGCEELKQEQQAIELRKKCEELKIGMSREEVIAIMGEPSHVIKSEDDGEHTEIFVFDSPRFAATYTQCVIDKESGLVDEIICGEGYRIRRENDRED